MTTARSPTLYVPVPDAHIRASELWPEQVWAG